jgi:site-specific recombinase XerD
MRGTVHTLSFKQSMPLDNKNATSELSFALRALGKLRREAPKSPFMFVSGRGGPFTTDSFNWLVKRAGQKAKLPFQAHAHMLRHACGYALANAGHDTRSLQDYPGRLKIWVCRSTLHCALIAGTTSVC